MKRAVVAASFLLLAGSLTPSAILKEVEAGAVGIDEVWQQLMDEVRDQRLESERLNALVIERAGAELGDWYCIGPFKDKPLGIHVQSFNHIFPPERDALSAESDLADLTLTYSVEKRPGMIDATRVWTRHPEWIDGYYHQLPMGPPPGWNETSYLYRTITTRNDAVFEAEIHADDDVRLWLNGELLGEAYATGTSSRFSATLRTTLNLKAGENRLLAKVTTMHGWRGFAFAIPLITPYNEKRPDQMDYGVNPDLENEYIRKDKFYPGNEPYSASVSRDATTVRTRYRAHREREDRIPHGAGAKELHGVYTVALLKILSLPEGAAELLPKSTDNDGLETVRELYYRACEYTDALDRISEFAFDVPIAPMYDPPRLRMQEVLDKTAPTSLEGEAYLDGLAALRSQAQAALEAASEARPNAVEVALAATDAIEKMWAKTIATLEPIAFVRSPPYSVNAIAPYTARGAAPSSICVYDPSRPTEPPRVIYENPEGAIFDMNASYDAKTLFFSVKPKAGVSGGWDIYEIGVDGTGLKRITRPNKQLRLGSEEDVFIDSSISPVELPSGELMFVSTRAGTYVNCQSEPAGHLYVSNRDGTNVHRVSGNTHSDHTPQVMNDGRVLFSRWDYGVDKNVFLRQSLWSMNPDGTRLHLFSGNTIENPNSFWEAQPIPGRSEVVAVFGPHHESHAGMIGLLWNQLGYEVPRGTGFRWVTQDLQLVEDITLEWGYQDPHPINERLFLVSYGGDGDFRNRIYLLDDRGNKKCIYEDPELGLWDPVLLRPRQRPTVLAPSSSHTQFAYRDPTEENQNPEYKMGTYVLLDVYNGLLPHVKRGEVKALAIMEQLSKTAYPRGEDVWGYSPTMGRGTMFARRFIGTVPVEEDGSAHFLAPAVRDISINALDAEGRVLKKMGSTTHIMPGEVVGCVGCHEDRHAAPPVNSGTPLAAQRAPSMPRKPDWGTDGIVDFVKVVQPVLDQYCVRCHGGPTPDGNVNLSNDKTRFFNMAYNQLVDLGMVDYANMNGTDHGETTAKSVGAIVSRIRDYIETAHSGQVLPLEDRKRIYSWIDSGIPYYGTYTFTNTDSRGGRGRWYAQDRDGWFQKDFVPVFNSRCNDCHRREINRQVYNYGPRHPDKKVTVTSDVWDNYALMTAGFSAIGQYGPSHRINLTHPEWSQMLTAPLAKDAGGLGLCMEKDGTPYIFKNKSDPDYQAMLVALRKGRDKLLADPRVDMLDQLPARVQISYSD